MTFEKLIPNIVKVIYQNENNLITGDDLQNVLLEIAGGMNELADTVSWENNNKLSLDPTTGHLLLDYTPGQMANFSIDNNGHLILIQ